MSKYENISKKSHFTLSTKTLWDRDGYLDKIENEFIQLYPEDIDKEVKILKEVDSINNELKDFRNKKGSLLLDKVLNSYNSFSDSAENIDPEIADLIEKEKKLEEKRLNYFLENQCEKSSQFKSQIYLEAQKRLEKRINKIMSIFSHKEDKECFDFNQDIKPIEFSIEALGVCPGPVTMIVAYGGSGKSWLGQYLTLGVATGNSIFGEATSFGKAAYVDFEQSKEITFLKFKRLLTGQNWTGNDNVLYFNPGVKLDSPKAEEKMIPFMTGKKLIIIDSLRACMMRDENDSSSRVVLDDLGRWSSKTGCSVIVLHHAGKSDKSDARMTARGTSALYDACANVWNLTKKGDRSNPEYHLTQTKDRIVCLKDIWYHLKDVGDEMKISTNGKTISSGIQIQAFENKKESIKDQILVLLQDGPVEGSVLLDNIVGKSQDIVKARKDLEASKQIIEEQVLGKKSKQYKLAVQYGETDWV